MAGTWAGTYRFVECPRAQGVLSNMCTSVGNAYPFTLELTQQGQTVTGRYALANVWFDLAPSEFKDQSVTLNGTGRIDSAGVQVQVTWSLSVGRPWLDLGSLAGGGGPQPALGLAGHHDPRALPHLCAHQIGDDAGDPALHPDVGRHTLKCHDGHRARFFGDACVLGVNDVHNHPALEHLREALFSCNS